MAITESYIRYSDHKQDDGFSVEYQQREIHDYCVRNGLEIRKEYIDQAQTATKVAGREEFFRLVDAVKAGKVQNIVVYKLSRLFRNSYESGKYRDLMRKKGVRLISVMEQIDEETSTGRLMTNFLSNIDQYQSETISDHVKSSMREMARQGYFTGGTVPFGYQLQEVPHGTKVRKKFVINEEEADVVRELFNLFSENYSLRYLQNHLTDNGFLTRRGKPFSIQTITRMLSNDFYIGVLRYKTKGYPDVVAYNVVPPIIEDELWRKVQIRKDAQKNVEPRRKKDLYSLTGKIHCGLCANHFFGVKSGSTHNGVKYEYKYYICSKRKGYNSCNCDKIRKDYIEQLLLNEIRTKILNETSIKQIAIEATKACVDSPESIKKEINKWEAQKKKLNMQLDKLLDLRLSNVLDDDILKRKGAEIDRELKEVAGRLMGLYDKQEKTVTVESVEAYLRGMLSKVDTENEEMLKVIFDNFVEDVVITNENVDIYLIVRPYGALEYKETLGHPDVRLYSNILK